MKKKASNLSKFILAVLTLILTVTICMPLSVEARGSVDTSKKGSLGLTYSYQTTLLPGVHVHLYRIADISSAGEFTLISPYDDTKQFPVTDLNKISDQSEWDNLLNPVAAYIYTNKVTPDAEAVSDADGKISFADLKLGIYLVVSDALVQPENNCTYSFSSFLTSIPGLDADDNWTNSVYDVVGVPKCKKTVNPQTVHYYVYKRWDDSGYAGNRPTSISVNIYVDGTLYTTQTLSAGNNWSYSWSYAEGHNFTVSENVSGSYSLSSTQDGNAFILTNTYNPPDNPPTYPDYPPDNPYYPGTPTTPSGEVAGVSRTPATPTGDQPAVLGAKRLPQTGQLWWPVPVLALAGMSLFGYGWYADRKKKKRDVK